MIKYEPDWMICLLTLGYIRSYDPVLYNISCDTCNDRKFFFVNEAY